MVTQQMWLVEENMGTEMIILREEKGFEWCNNGGQVLMGWENIEFIAIIAMAIIISNHFEMLQLDL